MYMNGKKSLFERRDFIKATTLSAMGLSFFGNTSFAQSKIQGFDEKPLNIENKKIWTPISDRKIRVGIVGAGVCKFGAMFGFQHHPNVEVVAVSDLHPNRCEWLAKTTGCKKTYTSLEKLIEDDSIEAVFIATDAPSHARHSILALERGKHVACAVPAVFGSLEDAEELYKTVKKTGLKYMMFETSMFRPNLYAMRKIHEAGGFGKIVYTEGEYWHYSADGFIPSYNDWRKGLPPMWYPTHNDAYYVGVTNGSFTEVMGLGLDSNNPKFPKDNKYKNRFSTEIAIYKTSEGGIARMARSSDTKGHGYGSETGRLRGTKGAYYDKYEGWAKVDTSLPALPDSMKKQMYSNHHGGSHAHLTNEFVSAILEDRKPLVDVAMALNMTVGGIVAHKSACMGSEWLKIPQFKF